MTPSEFSEWCQQHCLLFSLIVLPLCYVVVVAFDKLIDFLTLIMMRDDQ